MRKLVVIAACAVVVLAFTARDYHKVRDAGATDFEINWVAAQSVSYDISLYDRQAQRELAQETLGLDTAHLYRDEFTSFIGLPTTALLYAPFTIFDFDASVDVYRLASLLAFIAAVLIASLAVPRRSRLVCVAVGIAALAVMNPVTVSLGLGQVDAWIVLAVSVAVWAAATDRWWLCGAVLGVAVLLKLSPAIAVAYLLLRGRWRAVVAAAVVVVGALVGSLLFVSSGEIGTWLSDVQPKLSEGALNVQNQALPAWLARLVEPSSNLLSFDGVGAWRIVGLLAAIGVVAGLAYARRRSGFDPLELALMAPVAVLFFPISWDHYASWSIVPIVLLADQDRWQRLSRPMQVGFGVVTAGIAVAMARNTVYWSPARVDADPLLRIETGARTVALLAVLAMSITMLRWRAAPPAEGAPIDRSAVAVGPDGIEPSTEGL